ncbi:uncharacterized protein A4U43_C05F27750 [Asparagus officinalis]|uniref:Uncharacterized protein n=1 Tax=Asparagus officinalis TaxID=4686 RepID=A0A5P1EUZ1_ASPOF|nr:uncharacterized protein A4U43_C05F27750 [Asparagus officinalis]
MRCGEGVLAAGCRRRKRLSCMEGASASGWLDVSMGQGREGRERDLLDGEGEGLPGGGLRGVREAGVSGCLSWGRAPEVVEIVGWLAKRRPRGGEKGRSGASKGRGGGGEQ